MFRSRLLWIAYLVVGVFIASDHNYFDNVDRLKPLLSALLAVLLWPLVLLDVNLHIT